MGSLWDGAVDNFNLGGHKTSVIPSCRWPTHLANRVSFAILLAILRTFVESDGAMARNMKKWRTGRNALRHPPSQNGDMARQ